MNKQSEESRDVILMRGDGEALLKQQEIISQSQLQNYLTFAKAQVQSITLPSPSQEEMDSPEFNAIWEVIKTWDIKVPYTGGYCGGNGSHVKLLLDALKPVFRDKKIDEILNK